MLNEPHAEELGDSVGRHSPKADLADSLEDLMDRDLPLLRELALAPNDTVAVDAIRGLASGCSREELEAFLNQHDQELCAMALTALDEVLYMPESLKAKDWELER